MTLVEACQQLRCYKPERQAITKPNNNKSGPAGVSFAQKGDMLCTRCGRNNHENKDCHAKVHFDGAQLLTKATINANESQQLKDTWVLLDNCSTNHLFKNPMLLSSVEECDETLRVQSAGGPKCTNLIGKYGSIDDVWVLHNGIANVSSFKKLREKGVKFHYDNENDEFIMDQPHKKRFAHFISSPDGLYYHDVENPKFVYYADGKRQPL